MLNINVNLILFLVACLSFPADLITPKPRPIKSDIFDSYLGSMFHMMLAAPELRMHFNLCERELFVLLVFLLLDAFDGFLHHGDGFDVSVVFEVDESP